MPRAARIVIPQVAHHVVQRGNRRSRVFFTAADARYYLALLRQFSRRAKVEVLAYCLMPNHVHLVAVPPARDALARMLRPVHLLHAQRLNRARGWTGHLWQGRYFACAMDEHHLWAAIRYVERNPVRAGLVRDAASYPWSSARAHCAGVGDPVLTEQPEWLSRIAGITDWPLWLTQDDEERTGRLRRAVRIGRPCGTPEFLAELERTTGLSLTDRPQGRPRRT